MPEAATAEFWRDLKPIARVFRSAGPGDRVADAHRARVLGGRGQCREAGEQLSSDAVIPKTCRTACGWPRSSSSSLEAKAGATGEE